MKLKLSNVSKTYNIKFKPYRALKSLTLTFNTGEFTAIIGKSGSGKTTLLNLITGIDDSTTGEININDINLNSLSESKKALFRGKNIGIIFQFFQLMPTISVLDNILLPMDFSNTIPENQKEKRATKLLKTVGIPEHASKLPSELSGGEQQRVAIARAMANDPDIIIADEPTSALDSNHKASFVKMLFDECEKENITLVFVSHDESLKSYFQRCIKLGSINSVKSEEVE